MIQPLSFFLSSRINSKGWPHFCEVSALDCGDLSMLQLGTPAPSSNLQLQFWLWCTLTKLSEKASTGNFSLNEVPNIINITCIHLKLGWLSKIFIRGIFANHKILAVFSNYCAYQCPSLSELESSTAHSSELLQATWPRSCTTPPSPGSPASPDSRPRGWARLVFHTDGSPAPRLLQYTMWKISQLK